MGSDHAQSVGMEILDIRMCGTVGNRQYGEANEGEDLNHVNDNVRRSSALYAHKGNKSDDTRKDNTDNDFLPDCSEARIKGLNDIGNNQTHESDHNTGVDPVVEVGGPADDKLT